MLSCLDFVRDVDLLSITVRMVLAVICGGLIGIEREYKRRPAGFRTHILICLGAAMTTLTARLNQPDTVVTYSDKYRNPYALYTTEDGSQYKVWYENEQSVLDKLQLARMFGVTGVSLWRIGNIPASSGYDVWSAMLSTR